MSWVTLARVIQTLQADTGKAADFYTAITGYSIQKSDVHHYIEMDMMATTKQNSLCLEKECVGYLNCVKHIINQCYQIYQNDLLHLKKHGGDDPITNLIRDDDLDKALLHLLGFIRVRRVSTAKKHRVLLSWMVKPLLEGMDGIVRDYYIKRMPCRWNNQQPITHTQILDLIQKINEKGAGQHDVDMNDDNDEGPGVADIDSDDDSDDNEAKGEVRKAAARKKPKKKRPVVNAREGNVARKKRKVRCKILSWRKLYLGKYPLQARTSERGW